MVRTTSDKQIQGLFKDFQGEKLVFKDQCLFSISTFSSPFLHLKHFNFRFSNSSALVTKLFDEVSLCNDILNNDHSLAILLALTSEVKK